MGRQAVITRWYRGLGAKGGQKRARILSPERRRSIAEQASKTRWRQDRAKRLARIVGRTRRETRSAE